MKTKSIGTKFTRFLENRKYEKEQKFLNKYCNISDKLDRDTFELLFPSRKTIANYAKSKNVSVEISNAEKDIAKRTFNEEDESCINAMERAAKDKIVVTVRPLKLPKERKDGRLLSQSSYVSNDTNKTYVYKDSKNTIEDNFLRNIYRTIERNVKGIEHFYSK